VLEVEVERERAEDVALSLQDTLAQLIHLLLAQAIVWRGHRGLTGGLRVGVHLGLVHRFDDGVQALGRILGRVLCLRGQKHAGVRDDPHVGGPYRVRHNVALEEHDGRRDGGLRQLEVGPTALHKLGDLVNAAVQIVLREPGAGGGGVGQHPLAQPPACARRER